MGADDPRVTVPRHADVLGHQPLSDHVQVVQEVRDQLLAHPGGDDGWRFECRHPLQFELVVPPGLLAPGDLAVQVVGADRSSRPGKVEVDVPDVVWRLRDRVLRCLCHAPQPGRPRSRQGLA